MGIGIVKLSHEHIEYDWVTMDDLKDKKFRDKKELEAIKLLLCRR